MGQARLLLAAGIALGCAASGVAGCGHDGPEDPAVAVPGEGIPMGAASARGVGFDPPPGRPTEAGKGKAPPPVADPDDAPPDPFADPLAVPPGSAPGTGAPKPAPHHHPKPSKGMQL